MPNVYGTVQYEDYLKKYDEFVRDKAKDKYEWTYIETVTREYKDYKARLEVYRQNYLFEKSNVLIECADLKIEKGGRQIYVCGKMYFHRELLYFYNYLGQDYLLFRKNDLYGYTLLNLETLAEYNYFPSAAIAEEESFIITDAHIFKDILMFEGCIWACPYTCYLLDLKTYKTYGLWRAIDRIEIKDNGVEFVYCDDKKPQSVTYGYEDMKKLLDSSDSQDLYF